jgi:hypothetical protein
MEDKIFSVKIFEHNIDCEQFTERTRFDKETWIFQGANKSCDRVVNMSSTNRQEIARKRVRKISDLQALHISASVAV